jgi:hypothetical protein
VVRPLAVLALVLGLLSLDRPARAGCAGPSVSAVPAANRLAVSGANFVVGCQDSCSCTTGCGIQHCDCGPRPVPVDEVLVQVLAADGAVLVERQIDAVDGRFSVTLPSPAGAVEVVASGDGLSSSTRLMPG